jgi:hypothetical protein
VAKEARAQAAAASKEAGPALTQAKRADAQVRRHVHFMPAALVSVTHSPRQLTVFCEEGPWPVQKSRWRGYVMR